DATADVARAAGAVVASVADVRPDLGVRAGKGEALWKSLFVTSGDLLVFIDADLTEWGTHFVTGLLGPLLADPRVRLVKGFYDRLLDVAPGTRSSEGGRVTELVARPLLATRWPQLSAVVQPLAGEWAIRRSLFAQLPVPVGYGVELATLLDTWRRHGLDAIAQVDLGARGHRHQSVHDLGAMAVELLQVADRRSGLDVGAEPVELAQYDRAAVSSWRCRQIPVDERPPAAEVRR
ncbi:MAG: glucosyl-3-phosphoglycerate synthase, partial [Actinobacteria bacterium]|nr:glucosyl-3-phosphoglycerate synthase [Actinomycetota bacterium]